MHKELQRVELQIVKSPLEEPSNSLVQLVSVLTSTVRIFLTLGFVLQLQISVEVCNLRCTHILRLKPCKIPVMAASLWPTGNGD